jgi:Mg2+ and Co2+ transporter CorA
MRLTGDIQDRRKDAGKSISRTSSIPSTELSLFDNRTKPKHSARTTEDFEYLFEISRHIAHSVETTQIAAEVIERMRNACEALISVHRDSNLVIRTQKLGFLHSMLKGLHARSMSNEKRLTSEQVLVSPRTRLSKASLPEIANGCGHKLSNMISQRDSKVNREMSSISSEIAQATKADGAAMKTIALVTLTFLPATFVTVCCLHLNPSSSCKF